MAFRRSPTVLVALVACVLLAGCTGADVGSTTSPEDTPSPTENPTTQPHATTTASHTVTTTATQATAPPQSSTTETTASPVSTTETTASPDPTTERTTSPVSTTTADVTPTASTIDPRFGGDAWEVTVTRVVDGDTLDVRFPDGEVETVRLLGVDTPEVHTEVDPSEYEGVPDTLDGRDWLRIVGADASEYMARYDGATVVIETDADADRRGYYGRLLVYVYDEGTNVNRDLLRRGLARVYDSSFSLRGEFDRAEATAQANDVGVWAYEAPATTTQTDGGSGDAQLAVTTFHADAAGNDHTNENDEYITFTNTGDGPLDLSGWTISDAADHTYHVPNGVTLDAGDSITLYTGSGQNSATELYWGSDAAIWNNDGDTIIVKDDSGAVVLTEEY